MQRTVFFVSDSTGITAETIGHSILTQFEGVDFDTHRMPFVNDADKAHAAVTRIKSAWARTGLRPIVINTAVDATLSEILGGSGALMLDVFAPFIGPLEHELGVRRHKLVNRAHGLFDAAKYEARIDATNYALAHDDGLDPSYKDADLILIGVSRSGKTPTCLYMALHFGLRAANYPLTPEDLELAELPKRLQGQRQRLFGLTITAERLAQSRAERRPDSRYASVEQCRWELAQADNLFRREGIAVLNSTHTSIEEIGSKILAQLGIERHLL